jgi:hypothetical protein
MGYSSNTNWQLVKLRDTELHTALMSSANAIGKTRQHYRNSDKGESN